MRVSIELEFHGKKFTLTSYRYEENGKFCLNLTDDYYIEVKNKDKAKLFYEKFKKISKHFKELHKSGAKVSLMKKN